MTLLDRYRQVRGQTEALVEGLSAEDMTPQSMPDASPAKWHLAHTAWFFETFVLDSACPGWTPVDPRYAVLFNSCLLYTSPSPRDGLLSRMPSSA